MQRSLPRVAVRLAALALAATPIIAAATPAHASEIGSCSDAYQVGSTTVVPDERGQSAMSIKQYWSPSCRQNFAYAFVWQSFRNSHSGTWTVSVGEGWVHSPGVETSEGTRIYNDTRQAEFWSYGFAGSGKCTYADAALFWGNYVSDSRTDQRCG
ncbi:hypothetical protein Lfu02_73560 [Longispora fulva]|uniref:DUF2690 domain-containing protein n=1 Tax=Longispora fulva TaxID=619741 RepID=A0A8J7KFX1_9ACTN|nr:hypothetical protein [Longispora fulva]MBG6134269.1 hypothetical protein [Longispora fulva]GIG62984.1 hypothetical protein Lfu02_73560 [Longispora fulva]